MGLREIMQSNQPIVAVLAVVVIVGSIVWMSGGGSGNSLPKSVYFYDLGSGELFPADRAAQPPIDAPSGAGQGVKAVVYACGECNDAALSVAFLTTYTPEAVAAMKKMATATDGEVDIALSEAIERGSLVAVPAAEGAEVQWVNAMSEAGNAIMGRAGELCGNEPAKPCFP